IACPKPPPIPDRIDDLESFYHVLTWIAFRFTAHELEPQILHRALKNIYKEHDTNTEGISRGGNSKHADMNSSVYSAQVCFKNLPLDELINKLHEVLAVRYVEHPIPRDFEYHEGLRQQLDSKDWMKNMFDDALLQPGWEVCGGCIENVIQACISASEMRKLELQFVEASSSRPSKRSKLSNSIVEAKGA
ncbi:hypothetical protein AX17_006380, partial [Amanita inopinata Kibby_2008]